MRKRNAVWLLALTFAVGGIAAGCGGGDDDSGSSLTKAEWITKADAICAAGDREVNRQAQEQFGNQRPTTEQINEFSTQTVAPDIQDQIDKIKALDAPSEIEGQVGELLSQVQTSVDKLKSDPSQLDNKSLFADANATARSLGLKTCGSDG